MRWPFVSRLAYDAVRESNAIISNALSMERQVNASLIERLLSLKMADASELPTRFRLPAESTEVADSPSMNRIPLGDADPMRELIHARAGSNYRMRNMMLSQLSVDRADGKDDDAIREAILNGVPSDGVPS